MQTSRRLIDIATLLLMVVVAVVCWPTRFGGDTSFVLVQGESMEPALGHGSMAIVRAADDYRVGDIVAYRVPDGDPAAGHLVIHRIVGTSGDGYILKGDNRDARDTWRPTRDDVVGRVVATAPIDGGGLLAALPWFGSGLIGIAVIVGLWPRGGRPAHVPRPLPPPQGEPVAVGLPLRMVQPPS